MAPKALLFAGLLGIGFGGFAVAETIAIESGIAVKESHIATPPRGMTMNQVAEQFGAPTAKVPAVGKPPISRWEYAGFVVYFEGDRVIDCVVAG
jgi:hypothetical protein